MTSILDSSGVRDAALHLSVEQYRRLGEAGIIDEKTELLRGIIVKKMIKSPQHSWVVQKLAAILQLGCGEGLVVRQEQPLSLADSEPEPDLAVVRGSPDDYRRRHPRTALLVVEVAIATEELDREKAQLYAEADIGEYWLVLCERKIVERFSQPEGHQYVQRDVIDFNSSLTSLALPELSVALNQIS